MSVEARALALTVAYAAGALTAREGFSCGVVAVAAVLFPDDRVLRASFLNGYVDHFGAAIVAQNERVGAVLR